MKKLLLSALLCTGLTLDAHAQQSAIGLRGGLNLARYAGPNSRGGSTLVGGLAGVTVTSTFNKAGTTALEFELLYSGKGTKAEEGNQQLTQRLHYLDMPVLLQFRPGHMELELGPQFGLLLAQNTEYSDGRGNRLKSVGTGGFRSFQIGYVLGVGYRAPGGFGVGVRYNGAVSDISSGSGLRNSVFQFQLSYLLQSLQPEPEFSN
ncbi:PorT family protein [Microvirga sp. STR05]|uniref:PorT family protein n=1 Tax=Hymenobacter duratus TaxID=2771356 RepID=A0ABR8JBZ2_9BACT|nr:porin family protein [Hymenobacter duratus]MBD2714276.1 PorT family protein [Hymenobacter duratus]MBR7949179.1 PorT family protein [Microvirga sp. STR05]